MTGRVASFNHHGMTVADLARASRFFVDVLGFEAGDRVDLDETFSSGVSGVAGATISVQFLCGHGTTIELLQYEPPGEPASRTPAGRGAMHLALFVEGLDDVVDRARTHGWHPRGAVQPIVVGPRRGGRAVYLQSEEDGLVVELVEAAVRTDPIAGSR